MERKIAKSNTASYAAVMTAMFTFSNNVHSMPLNSSTN